MMSNFVEETLSTKQEYLTMCIEDVIELLSSELDVNVDVDDYDEAHAR